MMDRGGRRRTKRITKLRAPRRVPRRKKEKNGKAEDEAEPVLYFISNREDEKIDPLNWGELSLLQLSRTRPSSMIKLFN
ncbi:hypothetical protein Syun_017361 [Stephania yunnanensis]|uniref:Uncharacterized protein n=1 Tax=Stephania yunnanensis TaxID=152371 RepID=A0AAP0J6S7_9MAGN